MRPDSAPGPWTPGAEVAGKYRIERMLVEGETGTTFLATQLTLDRSVALHAVPPSFLPGAERTRLDAIVLGRLKHPNVAEVYDSGLTEDGGLFLVTEHVDGMSLSKFLDGSGMEIPPLLRLAQQICRGVQQAHAQGIVHLNFTPASVVVTNRGMTDGLQATVIDFAFGLMLEERVGRPPDGSASEPALPTYRAPEQLRGEVVDARTDVYALGVVMYEMLTGAPPFASRSPTALRTMHLEATVPPTSVAPVTGLAELEVVVRRCLAKEPDERYPHAGALLADLEAVSTLVELVDGRGAEHDAFDRFPSSSTVPPRNGLLDALDAGRVFSLPPSQWPMLLAVSAGLAASGALWWWFLCL